MMDIQRATLRLSGMERIAFIAEILLEYRSILKDHDLSDDDVFVFGSLCRRYAMAESAATFLK